MALNSTQSTGYKNARTHISLCLSVFEFMNEIFFGSIDSELLLQFGIRFRQDRILKLELK